MSDHHAEDPSAGPRRFVFLDVMRGLAMLFTIAVHTLWMYATPAVDRSALGAVIRFLGEGPAAPVFMFAMGASFALSPSSPGKAARRSGRLLAQAYLLNTLKFLVPMLVFRNLDEVLLVEARKGGHDPVLFYLGVGDILQLAAIALLVMAAVHRWARRRALVSLLLATAVVLAAPHLWGKHVGIAPVDYLLDLLWGSSRIMFFPVFPWLAYPLSGLAFGELLQRHTASLRRFFLVTLAAGLVLAPAGILLTQVMSGRHWVDYYRPTPASVLHYLGFLLCWSAAAHGVGHLLKKGAAYRGLFFLSKHVTLLYILQWTMIAWFAPIFGPESAGYGRLLFLIAFMTALTIAEAHLFLFVLARRSRRGAALHAVKTE